MTTEQQLAMTLTRVHKLQAELDSLMTLYLQTSRRLLRLELAVSVMALGEVIQELLTPEQPAADD